MLQVAKRLGGMSPSEVAREHATTQRLSPKTTHKRSIFSIHTSASAWISILSEWLVFMRGISKVVAFSLLSSLPIAYGADGSIINGDEFSNNLFSDLAPLLTLFGEQVTKQFISQSMGWADNILLAMAPLGILTVMVSAIRVGGEQWLKNIIGRARESDGLAEAELMSSTSPDVCELWSGRGVVRVLGSPDVVELVYTASSDERLIGGAQYGGGSSSIEGDIYDLKGAIGHGLYQLKSSGGSGESATLTGPPNLVLNVCGPGVAERELWIYVILGIILQISVWGWCILAVAFFKYEKGGYPVKPYALPVTITGSFFVCLGILLCSHVVEASTTEHTYRKGKGVRTVFLQRGGQIVNDQRFEGYAIFTHPKQETIKVSCKNKANFGALINLSTTLALIGFVAQFIGLRAMHWSCTIAQLLATLMMTIFRAAARRGLSTLADATPITEGYELQWLAKHLNYNDHWAIETGLIDLSQEKRSLIDQKNLDSSSKKVAMLLQSLLAITSWERPLQKLAISTGRAMENILNTITEEKDIDMSEEFLETESINFKFPVNFDGSSAFIDFKVTRARVAHMREWGPWVADTSKLEAILSLWMLSQKLAQKDWDIAAEAVRLMHSEDRHYEIEGYDPRMEKSLQQARGTTSLREPKYNNRINRQKYYCDVILQRSYEIPPATGFLQILGRFGEQREKDYATWVGLLGPDSRFRARGISRYTLSKVSRELNAELPNGEHLLYLDGGRPGYTNFGFLFDAYSNEKDSPRTGQEYFASVTEVSGDEILGLDLVGKFMWKVTEDIVKIRGVTRGRIFDFEESGDARVNSVLNKMAQSIVEAGLGGLQDAYHIIIPPLSAAGKLPSKEINATGEVIEA